MCLFFQFESGSVICVTWLINSTQVKHTDGTHIIGIDKAAVPASGQFRKRQPLMLAVESAPLETGNDLN